MVRNGAKGRSGRGAKRRGRGRRSKDAESIARERMEILVGEAGRAARDGKVERARRYVELAQRIGMRHNVPMARQWKRWICGACGTYLVPGRNATVRVRPGRIVTRCNECGHVTRTGTVPKRKKSAKVSQRARAAAAKP